MGLGTHQKKKESEKGRSAEDKLDDITRTTRRGADENN